MIKVNQQGEVYFEKDKVKYSFKTKDEYKKFIFLITDPKKDLVEEDFKIDDQISDQRLLGICTKYQEFFMDFILNKEKIKKSVDDQINTLVKQL